MMGKQQQATATTQNFKAVIQEGTAQVEQATQQAKNQAVDAVLESKEQLLDEAKQLNTRVQEQLNQLKDDVQHDILQRLSIIQAQLSHSKQDFSTFRQILKQELSAILQEVAHIGKELKEDVGELSGKHKAHLIATFKKSTTQTKAAWEKVTQGED